MTTQHRSLHTTITPITNIIKCNYELDQIHFLFTCQVAEAATVMVNNFIKDKDWQAQIRSQCQDQDLETQWFRQCTNRKRNKKETRNSKHEQQLGMSGDSLSFVLKAHIVCW